MKVSIAEQQLVISPGLPRATVRIPLADIKTWDCLYEVVGRRFLAFHLGDRTAYAQLPRMSPQARLDLMSELERLLQQPADVSLLDSERDNEHWLRVWEVIKTIGRYLRLFVNPLRPPTPPPRPRPSVKPDHTDPPSAP
ncbi:MAG: hypothetical protein Q8K94_04240 [Moraxellaceae bacterium]|nr:hypothetical protein [Moraxellaceae bacterium]MDP1775811.1 hypothetical protein [Moraxellaceae bacterium]